jgi:hypothetical protein
LRAESVGNKCRRYEKKDYHHATLWFHGGRMLHYFDGSLEIALWKGIPFVKAYPFDDDHKSVGFFHRL